MAIEIWDGQWRNSSDPEIYTNTGWKDIMEGHAYIGNSVWNRFFIRVTPVAPTLGNVSRTNSSLTFSYSHPGDSSGVYLVLKLVRVSDNTVIAGPENTSLTSGAISGNKTYTGLSQGVSYRFEAYAVYNSYSINSSTATITRSTLSFSATAPTLALSSRTVNSITVNAQVSSGSPYNTRIVIWNNTNGSALNASYLPNGSGTVGSINSNYISTGLVAGSSYEFAAYTEYRDASTLEVITQSSITYFTTSTLNYVLTTPTQPYYSDRQLNTLSFRASSNANYSANGSSYTANAYIEFNLYRTSNDAFVSARTAALPNNDTLTELEVQFTGLSSGVSYYCRARTYYYSPVSQYSSYSVNSAAVSTLQLTTSSTGLITANNTTYLNSRLFTPSSTAEDSNASNASDGSTGTSWFSDPFTSTVSGDLTIGEIERTPTRIRYITPTAVSTPLTGGSSVTITASPPAIVLRQTSSLRLTYRWNPAAANVAPPTLPNYPSLPIRTDLVNNASNHNWVFGSSTTVFINPTPVPGFLPGLASPPLGTVVISKKNANRLQFNVPGGSSTTNPNGTVPLTPADTPHPAYISAPRPGLDAIGATVSSFSKPALGGVIVEIPDSSVPSFPAFSVATVISNATMKITGTIAKAAGGTEFLNIYVTPKSGTYSNPRMISGTNTVRVSIPNIGSAMTVKLYTTNSSGGLIDHGSVSIPNQGSHTFNLLGSSFPYYDPTMGADTFRIYLVCTRISGGLLGNIAAISEVEFSYSYDTYA